LIFGTAGIRADRILEDPIMRDQDRIDFSVKDRVAVIAMKRAPVNAIDHEMIDAIHAAHREADADKEVRAVILTSALPGVFCGGMDLKMAQQGDALSLRSFTDKFYIETMGSDVGLRPSSTRLLACRGQPQVCFQREADMSRQARLAGSVANEPIAEVAPPVSAASGFWRQADVLRALMRGECWSVIR
jgi:hypothetical protein